MRHLALDIWLGRQTRTHGDFDVGCWAGDVASFVESLDGWDAFRAEDGAITPLAEPRPPPPRSIWLRRRNSAAWDLQLMPETDEGGTWRYRRDPRIARPLEDVLWVADSGIAALRPEIQLLYKARDIRPQDQADFEQVAPTLDPAARRWLAAALKRATPSSPWLDQLTASADP